MPDAGEDLHPVLFDLHPAAAAVALLASRQFGIDVVRSEAEACGDTLEYRRQPWTVRFAGGQEAQHGADYIETTADGISSARPVASDATGPQTLLRET